MSILDKLYDYQTYAVDFALCRPGSMLYMEQGTGKTWVTAGVIESLVARANLNNEPSTILLVVPLSNLETTWVKVLTGLPQIEVLKSWDGFKASKKKHRVLLLHYEALRGNSLIKKVTQQRWSAVVYDESQRLKARGSKQSRVSARFKNVDHRILLSGTPVEQTPLDLWAQFRFACPRVFGTSWAPFVDEWCDRVGFMGYELRFREAMMPQFLELIEPHILRIRKEDALDLPPLTMKTIPVEMYGEQRRVYDELEQDMVAEVQGHTILADLKITQLIRLQQVCGGFIRVLDDEQEERSLMLGSAKARKLKHLLHRMTPPVVVFCKYREEVDQCVAAASEYRVATIRGSNRKTRTATIESFQRGEIDVLVCQIRAGGVGIDLYTACLGIVYSSTFSFIDFDQAVSRLHRHGQSQEVRFFLLCAKNTVDELIYEALLSKQLVSERILRKRMKMSKNKKPAAPAPKTAPVAAKPAKAAPAKEPTEATEEKAPKEPEFKYGVKALAEALGIKEASVRVRLRNKEVEKAGKTYGWNTKAELAAVVEQLKKAEKAPKADADEDEDEGDADED